MIDPPFLDLAYYVGISDAEKAAQALIPGITSDDAFRGVEYAGAVGRSEEIGVLRIKPNGVLLLTGAGEFFCGPERKNRKRLNRLGYQTYRRFLEVADRIPCWYGAILVEYPLESPNELLLDPKTLAFTDFFVSRARLGSEGVERVVQEAGQDAYVELTHSGVYISLASEFNPQHRGVDPVDAQCRSIRIGAIVGRACSRAVRS